MPGIDRVRSETLKNDRVQARALKIAFRILKKQKKPPKAPKISSIFTKKTPKRKDRDLARKDRPGRRKGRDLERKDRDMTVFSFPQKAKKTQNNAKKATKKKATKANPGDPRVP